ncbi:hypothetical protein [Clostridium estertheticum]|nr:hypothetical protein [Clostridium estertheticum]MCB2360562.1 hypothetical protein [Clostridium estertheticum]
MSKLFEKLFDKNNRQKIVEMLKRSTLYDALDVADTFNSKSDEPYVKMN